MLKTVILQRQFPIKVVISEFNDWASFVFEDLGDFSEHNLIYLVAMDIETRLFTDIMNNASDEYKSICLENWINFLEYVNLLDDKINIINKIQYAIDMSIKNIPYEFLQEFQKRCSKS